MRSLPDTVSATLSRRALLPADGPLLLMVSGGGDSVALLQLAADGVLGARPLRVLHVNHLLRADASDEDEAFVRALCDRLAVELRVVRYDVAAYAEEHKLNLEDAGRRVRYRFADEELDAWCSATGRSRAHARIAVAHTLDDRIETFFTRAVSGAGMGALSSIAPTRGRIVRPLIDAERSAVREYVIAVGGTWREDESNTDTSRQRALVRAELLPVAERLNPSFRSTLARTMDLLGEEDALLGSMADAFARDFADVADGRITLEREMMGTLDRTMARRTIRSALGRAFPEATRLEASHVEALVDGLREDGFARDLPEGIRAVSEYGSMVISRREAETTRVAPSLLPVPGSAALGGAGSMRAEPVTAGDISGSPDTVVIDAGSLHGELIVDSVLPGDRMRPLGMSGTRKLSDLLIDHKVPRRMRTAMPVVRDGERIVWLAGVRMSEDYRVTGETECAVRLTWRRGTFADGSGSSAEDME